MPFNRKSVVRFVALFAVCYAALLYPWPGWRETYASGFRALTRAVFAEESPSKVLRIGNAADSRPSLDLPFVLGNPKMADPRGGIPARSLGLDTRALGWIPTSLFLALVVAFPLHWPKRLWTLATGLLVLHAYYLFSVACYLWNEEADFGVIILGPFWRFVVDGLTETLVRQMGMSFVMPVVLWAALTFRREDFEGTASPVPGENEPAQKAQEPMPGKPPEV